MVTCKDTDIDVRNYAHETMDANIETSRYYIDNLIDVNVESMYYDPEAELIHWYELDPHGDNENGVFNEYIIDKNFAKEAIEHNNSDEIIGYVDGNCPNQNAAATSSQEFVKMADEYIRISEIAESELDDNYITIDHSSDDDLNKAVTNFFMNKFGLAVAPERTAEDISVGDRYRYNGAEVKVVSGLDMAKKYIEYFLDSEFSSTADFSDVKHIAIGYTEIGSEEQGDYSLQVEANLVDCEINYYIDGEIAKTEKYDSLAEMNECRLSCLDFEEFLHIGTTELDRILEEKEKAAPVKVVLAVSQCDTNRYYIANNATEEAVRNLIVNSDKLFMDICALGNKQIDEATFAKYSQTEGIAAIDVNIDERIMHVYDTDKPIVSFDDIQSKKIQRSDFVNQLDDVIATCQKMKEALMNGEVELGKGEHSVGQER